MIKVTWCNNVVRFFNQMMRKFIPTWNQKAIDNLNVNYTVNLINEVTTFYYDKYGHQSPSGEYYLAVHNPLTDPKYLVDNQLYLNAIDLESWPHVSVLTLAFKLDYISETTFKFQLWSTVQLDMENQRKGRYEQPDPAYNTLDFDLYLRPILIAYMPEYFNNPQ